MQQLSALLDTTYFDDVLLDCYPVIEEDRQRYCEIYDEISRYCKQNNIFISDPYELIETKDDYLRLFHMRDVKFSIYTDDPLVDANNMTNAIYNKIKDNPKYKEDLLLLRMKTVQEKREFTIEFDTRIVAVVYRLQKQKDKTLFEYIKPEYMKDIPYLPAEIEIIDVYKNLYSLESKDNLSINILYEKKLHEQISVRKEKGFLGGSCKERKRETIEYIKLALVSKWARDNKTVCLVGVWAYHWLKDHKNICTNKEKVQIISSLPVEDILIEVEKFVHPMTKFQITAREQQLYIPKDFRTRRYTFYMHIETERGIVEKPFMDLFNCAEFDVIPFSLRDGIQIADVNVILRFLYIDLWILKLIHGLKKITTDVLILKINSCWNLINEFRGDLGNELRSNEYFGTYRNYLVDKKKENLKGKRYSNYVPHANILDDQELRDM